jgi:hypothetical protein
MDEQQNVVPNEIQIERPYSNPQIFLGTSSFTATGWEGSFYPKGMKSKDYLGHYAKTFGTVEIDSTFYGTPSAASNGVLVPSEEIDKTALQESFLEAGQPSNPTPAQCMEIITDAIRLAEAAREKRPEASEEQALLASFNSIFTSSYARVVGTPKFEKVDGERIFAHAEHENGQKIEGEELKSLERAWMQTVESTFVRIVGKGPYAAWLDGGPDIVALGRGADKFTLTDVNLNVEAA